MKTVIKIIYVVILEITLSGCHHTYLNSQLVLIDSLLLNELPDSAHSLICNMDKSQLNDENLAYYHLLLTQSQYKAYLPIKSDSVINLALDYYQKTDDKDKLARAYYYKGCILDDLKRHKEGMEYMKKAGFVAKGSRNYILLHNIAFYIGVINLNYNENKLAIENLKLALYYSKKTQKSNHLLFDFERLAICYWRLNEKDSMTICIDSIFRYINSLPESQQQNLSGTFTILGNSFINIDTQKAEELYKKAISIKQIGSAYGSLAWIKLHEGNLTEARELALKGIETSETDEIRSSIIRILSNIEKASGNYEQANELSQQALLLKDSLSKQQQSDNVKAVQITHDGEDLKSRKNRQLRGALIGLVIVTVIGGSASWLQRSRKKEAERMTAIKTKENAQLAQANEELTRSNEQLNEEKRQSDMELRSVSRKLAGAEKKLKNWEAQQKATLKEQKSIDATMAKGHRLFHELTEGGTTVLWRKQDFSDFFDFYCQIDGDFREQVGQRYSHLTPNTQVLLVLQHLGLTDDELCERMNLTRAALRTMKWRIKTSCEN